MIISGIHASPGTGRSKSKIGLANKSTFLYHAIQIPSGVPITTPSAQPPNAIFKEEPMCCGSVAPSGAELLNFAIKVFITVTGPGSVDELVSFNTSQQNHQIPTKPITDRIDNIHI